MPKGRTQHKRSIEMRKAGFVRILAGLIFVLGSLVAFVGPVLMVLLFVGELEEPSYTAVLFGLLICFNGIAIAAGGHIMWSSCMLRQQRRSKPSAALPKTVDMPLRPEPYANAQQALLPSQILKLG